MAKIVKNNISYTSIPSSASMVPYDNYDSGLEATNVKDAIDELAEGGTGVHTLEGLDDVTISSATNGQVLKYNGTDWVNANDSGGVSTLGELTDVSISSVTNGQVLKYNGSEWVNAAESGGGASVLTDLTDVSIASASNGQVLTYNFGDWVNMDLPSPSISLDNLTNVSIASPSNNQVLKYDNGIWVNANDSGGTTVIANPSGSSTTDLTKLQVDNTIYAIPSGGSNVSVTQIQSAGTKIATITVDSVDTDLYAPNGGASALDDLTDVDITSATDGQVLKYDSTTHQWVNGSGGGGSGGHTIVNEDGTSFTQRANLQFNGSYLEDNSVDDTTEVNVVREMTKSQFNSLSADEKVGLIHITDESDAAPLADLPDVNLTSPTNGQVLKYNSTSSKWENADESGGGSGGHTIVDEEGTSLTQRTNLQFNGAYLEDNSTDDTTEVNVVRSMTRAEFDQLSADEKQGIIEITDESTGMATWTDLTGTLTTGSTSITISSADITTNSVIEVFDSLDVPYTSKTLSTGSIVLTFDAQESDMTVMVRVS